MSERRYDWGRLGIIFESDFEMTGLPPMARAVQGSKMKSNLLFFSYLCIFPYDKIIKVIGVNFWPFGLVCLFFLQPVGFVTFTSRVAAEAAKQDLQVSLSYLVFISLSRFLVEAKYKVYPFGFKWEVILFL